MVVPMLNKLMESMAMDGEVCCCCYCCFRRWGGSQRHQGIIGTVLVMGDEGDGDG